MKYENVHSFMHRSEGGFISTRCVNTTFGEMYCLLQSSLDIDVIVLEIKDLTAMKFPVFYIFFCQEMMAVLYLYTRF